MAKFSVDARGRIIRNSASPGLPGQLVTRWAPTYDLTNDEITEIMALAADDPVRVAFLANKPAVRYDPATSQAVAPDGTPVSGGGSWTQVAYAAALALDGQKYMPDTTLAAATTFSVAGTPVAGASIKVGLIADGVSGHVPTLSAFYADPNTDAYNNTAGRLNNLLAWNDGARSWYKLSDTGLTVSLPASALTLTGPSSGNTGSPSSNFTVTANGSLASSVTVTPTDSSGGGTFTPTSLTLTDGSRSGTFTYTAASDGAKTIGVTNTGGLTNPSAITYTASTASAYLRMTSLTTATESGTGPYTYTATANNAAVGVPNLSLASAADGEIQATLTIMPSGFAGVGFGTTSAAGVFSTFLYLVYANSNISGTGTYKIGLNGAAGIAGNGADNAATPAAGDILRVSRTGSAINFQVARSGTPTTWLTLHTIASGGSTAQLYPRGTMSVSTSAFEFTSFVGLT